MYASPFGTPVGTVKLASSEPRQLIGSNTQVMGRYVGSPKRKTAWHLLTQGLRIRPENTDPASNGNTGSQAQIAGELIRAVATAAKMIMYRHAFENIVTGLVTAVSVQKDK